MIKFRPGQIMTGGREVEDGESTLYKKQTYMSQVETLLLRTI
nr:hypothetical protein [Scytonema sp. UIC 10036]